MQKIIAWWFGGIIVFLFITAVVAQFRSFQASSEDTDINRMMDSLEDEMAADKANQKRRNPYALGMEALKSPDPQTRLKGLAMITTADQAKAAPVVLEFIADPDPAVRTRAIQLTGVAKTPGAGAQLVTLLEDPEATIRSAAQGALMSFTSEPGLCDALSSPLRSRDPAVINAAIQVWNAAYPFDRQAGLRTIRVLLFSTNPEIVQKGLGALSGMNLTTIERQMIQGDLQSIIARFPETPAASAAQAML